MATCLRIAAGSHMHNEATRLGASELPECATLFGLHALLPDAACPDPGAKPFPEILTNFT